MSRLILTHEGAVIKEYPLNKERLTVGRKPQNDIQLDDATVSGVHAAFLVLQHVYIEDLNSTNGVLLNGKKVSKRQLNHGDVVRVGRHEFKFIDDNAEDFESTVVISFADAPQASAPPPEPPKVYVMKVMNGSKSGEEIALSKPYTTVGSPGSQVAVIARRGAAYFLMPMGGTGSHQRPVLNGTPLGAESQLLKTGDIVEVAGVQLQFSEA